MVTVHYFEVAPPIEREAFLAITNEVLETSLLIFAPFGLPRHFRLTVGTEASFLRIYGPRFRLILEAVSEAVYAYHGVSESEVAVTLHKYTEEEQDEEAVACIGKMSDALRLIYSPPRVIELPEIVPITQLALIGLTLLRTGAIYTPWCGVMSSPRFKHTQEHNTQEVFHQFLNSTQELLGGQGGSESAVQDSATPCIACQARCASAGYMAGGKPESPAGLLGGISATVCNDQNPDVAGTPISVTGGWQPTCSGGVLSLDHPDEMTFDYDKARRARVEMCSSALQRARLDTTFFSERLQQAHLQALAESHAARYSIASEAMGILCACQSGTDSIPSEEGVNVSAALAVDEVAAISFMDNELFVLLRNLELRIEKNRAQAAIARNEQQEAQKSREPTKQADHDDTTALQALQASRAFWMRAEETMDQGKPDEAAALFDEAYNEGLGHLPDKCLAQVLAGRAKCYLQQRDFNAAMLQAEKALGTHEGCGDALLVRGQCRRQRGDHENALNDLVNAFVLQGSAVGGTADGGEAQAIEDVSREACRVRAGKAFAQRAAGDTLPADWMVRSYMASYTEKDLGDSHEAITSVSPIGGIEGLEGEDAFRLGVHLQINGRYAESMKCFGAALQTENTKIQSLAFEHHGSFLYLTGDVTEALEAFRRSSEADSANVKSRVKEGSVLVDLGRRNEALESFAAAEAIDPLDSDLFLHRGQGHLVASDFALAAKDLERSVSLCSTMPIAWAAWGVSLFKLATVDGQPSPYMVTKCLKVMEDALERFPESSEVLLFFSEVLVSLGDFARALTLLRRSSVLERDSPLPYVNAARAYLGMNDLVAARRHLEKGQEIDPHYPGTFMDLGQLLMQEGSPAEALTMYAHGVDRARFPSEIHDAMSCLDVAKCHLEAQRLLREQMLG